MNEDGDGSLVNMYAQLDSQEMPIPKDLSDYWQDPSSYFLIPGQPPSPITSSRILLCIIDPRFAAAPLQMFAASTPLQVIMLPCYSGPLPCSLRVQLICLENKFVQSSFCIKGKLALNLFECLHTQYPPLADDVRFHLNCSACVYSLFSLHSAGALLKETIEDLEWTATGSNNSSVEVYMQRQPRRLFFSAQAAGSLQVG